MKTGERTALKRLTDGRERWKRSMIAMAVVVAMVCVVGPITSVQGASSKDLQIAWTNNMLTISGPRIPGEKIDTWYLEAFCRTGSTRREWPKTVIPHKTELISAKPGEIRLRTVVEPNVEVLHIITARRDEVDFRLTLENKGTEFVDVDWFQPCMRVNRFTGRTQADYVPKCFIFTESGLTTLDKTRRTEEAIYRGGQVYVPAGINLADVNPRPISPDQPVNGLIGCFSADDRYLLATAWDKTQELFQGVIVCIHNDPRIGGLKAGEKKKLHGKVYIMENNPKKLLRRYNRDFPKNARPESRAGTLMKGHSEQASVTAIQRQ